MKTPSENGARWKFLSYLLMYPTGELHTAPEDLSQLADRLFPRDNDPKRHRVKRFLGYLRENSVLGLQEVFTAAFDLNPATCLNLTYHTHGDGKKRGQALARFQEVYNRAGFSPLRAELPDYLPMVMEFLSICDPKEARRIMDDCREAINTIKTGLIKDRNPYAGILETVREMLDETV